MMSQQLNVLLGKLWMKAILFGISWPTSAYLNQVAPVEVTWHWKNSVLNRFRKKAYFFNPIWLWYLCVLQKAHEAHPNLHDHVDIYYSHFSWSFNVFHSFLIYQPYSYFSLFLLFCKNLDSKSTHVFRSRRSSRSHCNRGLICESKFRLLYFQLVVCVFVPN